MKEKVLGANQAVGQGVGKVVFADAHIECPVRAAMVGKGMVIE